MEGLIKSVAVSLKEPIDLGDCGYLHLFFGEAAIRCTITSLILRKRLAVNLQVLDIFKVFY